MFVSGLGFFSKPSCAQTTVAIDPQGRFFAIVSSGGLDHTATVIALLAVPSSVPVPCYLSQAGVPPELEAAAAAKIVLQRPNPQEREIVFAGETWIVKSSADAVWPGPNFFSDTA